MLFMCGLSFSHFQHLQHISFFGPWDLVWKFPKNGQAMVYIEDTGADNDGQIGTGIDVMVPTNGPDSQDGNLDDCSTVPG